MSSKGISGIVINSINEGSEGIKVGLREGDVILKYDQLYPNGDISYLKDLCQRNEGKINIELVIMRDGSLQIIYVDGGELGINGTIFETQISPKQVESYISVHKDQTKYMQNETDSEFKTLLAYGKFISGFGWVVCVGGIIGLLIGFANMSALGVTLISGGIVAFIAGIGFVANGQLISCFVSIERNTKKTNQLLESKNIK